MLSQSESESEAIRPFASDSDSGWDSICLWFRFIKNKHGDVLACDYNMKH